MMEPPGGPRPTAHSPPPPQETLPTTDYGAFVLAVLADMTRRSQTVDQAALRHCLGLSSSYLMTDATTNPTGGFASWNLGFSRLVDVLVALDARDELELETVSAASKACSECWTAASNWRGLESCRDAIRSVAAKLKRLLDENGRTYRGGLVYVP
ncbi:hypothetical protein K488DRAFT_81827 [Vararia minispora EC-137]|uniref:Uncharacterized protein n=1 Tax=Vararia minispora EC-137 TaxID=1314806 RepID=A0ACB8QZY6_9AGAM|nr:hypothetical protein K488DRAFT_81827 [Vararia minispora EC-137]